ncbi:MAG TPA: TonB-dependent receptor [Ignavibacteriales bacterium]|nr:TonB-dependent receptor [Ignavibacteriales bacterium]
MKIIRIFFKVTVLLILIYFQPPVFAQNVRAGLASLKGIVRNEKGDALPGANVVILENGIGSEAGMGGSYLIQNVKPGLYTLRASYLGYEYSVKNVVAEAGKASEINFFLKSSSFQIGGIEVLAETGLLPTDVVTKTLITSGEIEHYQASSLKDVLDLVPGVQITDNPGIGKTGQAAIRGDEQDLNSAFGTLILVDGAPVSNNANLQYERMYNSSTGSSNLGGGADLRTIPADNIESIEVITGLPSVRYGDMTEGVINVKTKSGPQPNRLKIKNNPDTREANLGGGFNLASGILSYNLNAARSERDLRKQGDEYTRLSAQSIFSASAFKGRLKFNNKLQAQMPFDEEAPKGDIMQTKNYNRGYYVGYSGWGKYTFEEGTSSLEYNSYLNLRRENSMKSKLNFELVVLPGGDTVSSYIGKLETRGSEWNLGGRLEWNKIYFTGNLVHNLMLGTEVEYNANTGEGIMLDSVLNYYGADSPKRSYRFDDIPGQALLSLYAQNKMTWHSLFDFSLTLGLRYEMNRPYEFNLKGILGDGDIVRSRRGSFLNPRMNFMVYFSHYSQLRFSAGITTKSPAMSAIYVPPTYGDWRNPLDGKTYYYIMNRRAPDLKGFRVSQFEVSYDHSFFNFLGTTFSAYYKERKNENESQMQPVTTVLNNNGKLTAYFIDDYYLQENLGWTISKGLEFTLRTGKIKPLNMSFMVTGSYYNQNSGTGVTGYDFYPDISKGRIPNYKPSGVNIDTLMAFAYKPGTHWNDRLQINYYLKYTMPPLGLWVTLRAEQLLFENVQSLDQEYEDYNLLTESGKINYDFQRRIVHKDGKWLLNINISKSLFKGAEISFYVDNLLDDPAISRSYITPAAISESARNPDLFYGIEFSCILDNFFNKE